MLTILKEEPNESLNKYLKSFGVESIGENKIIMAAKDGEKYLGAGMLELKGYKVYLNEIVTTEDDLILKLSVLKSLLNLADLRGIKNIYGNNPDLASYYKMARFKEINDEFCVELEGYFECCE